MASIAEIKKVILDLAGNPESGAIAALADEWATAIHQLDNTPTPTESKEKRVTKPEETR
jgi:hypothetical protein